MVYLPYDVRARMMSVGAQTLLPVLSISASTTIKGTLGMLLIPNKLGLRNYF